MTTSWLGKPLSYMTAGALLATALSAAHAADAPPAPRQVKLNGYVSVSYNVNDNRPPGDSSQLRVFDAITSRPLVDVAELVVHYDAANPGEFGFRLDAAVGSGIPPVTAATGMFRDEDTGHAHNYDIQQAFLGYVVPVGSGLKLEAGKFITHVGYEAVDRWDGTNANATRSFLFGYSAPFTNMGVRAGYTFGPKFAGALYVLNGWDTAKTSHGFRTFGAQGTWTYGENGSLIVNLISGPEQPDNNGDRRNVLDVCLTGKLSPRLAWGFNADVGREAGLLEDGGSATWRGAAVYVTAQVHGPWSVSFRGEVFDDVDGVRTGTPQKLTGITLTPAVKLPYNLVARADLRVDRSDEAVFLDKDGSTKKTQPTLTVNLNWTY